MPGLDRIRLSSIDPAEVDDALFALLTQEPRVMPHVHLSLQAGDDLTLKRMKRRHSRADAVRLVERLKVARPEIAIGADLIAGFPTEDDDMAARTLAIVDDCDIVHAHVFPYSPRAGTPAARMPQVAPDVARARAERLRAASATRKAAWLATLVGTVQPIVIERPGDRGHAPGFAEAPSLSPPDRAGRRGHHHRRHRHPSHRNDTMSTSWHYKLLGGFRRTSYCLVGNLAGLGGARLDEDTLDGIEEALIASAELRP
ncbi:radical SAM protein [Sphingomonas sp. MMS24-JH45]